MLKIIEAWRLSMLPIPDILMLQYSNTFEIIYSRLIIENRDVRQRTKKWLPDITARLYFDFVSVEFC
jgi:hypothetical protein